jgi:hypothetical protein
VAVGHKALKAERFHKKIRMTYVCVWLKLSLSNIANGVGASRPRGLRKETSPLLERCDVFINTDDDHRLGT